MNINNALGFIVLGLLMLATPAFAEALTVHPVVVAEASVRTLWLEVMGWVTGGIGSIYIARDAALRVPSLLAALIPERLLRPIRGESERMPNGVRVTASS
jgi:hypothetical protein